jgi:hypothetical protein
MQLGKIGLSVVKISSFTFKIQQVKRNQNILADAVRRMFQNQYSQSVLHVTYRLLPSSLPRFFDNPEAEWGAIAYIPEVGEKGTLSSILP